MIWNVPVTILVYTVLGCAVVIGGVLAFDAAREVPYFARKLVDDLRDRWDRLMDRVFRSW